MAIPLHVLIVEDSENDAELMLLHLRKGDFEVSHTRVETAEAMRAALQQHAWDMVISDYNLPTFSAPAALSILQESGLDIPLIIASGTITEETAIDLMRAGAADYLMKDRLARLAPLAKRELNITRVRRERKEARAVLLETETLFHTLSEQSPFGVLILDPETTLPLEFNAAVHQQLGYTRQEFARLRISDYEAIEKPEETHVHTQKVLVESWDQFETLHRTKKGEIRNVHVSAQLLELSGRQVFHCIYRDITERKQAEEALRKSEERFSSIFNTTGEVIFLLDVDPEGEFRFNMVNPAFLSTTGLPVESVIGKNIKEIIPEPSLTLVLGKYRQAIQEKAIVRWEETSDYPTGRLTALVTIAPILDPGGTCHNLVGNVRDITERKRAEEALRESERHLRSVIKAAPVALWDLDNTGTILLSEGNALARLGVNPGELIGQSVFEFNKDDPEALALIRRGLTGEEFSAEVVTGGRHWNNHYVPRRDNKGNLLGLIGISMDITERKQAERSLVESEQKYRLLHESAGVGIGYYTPEGVVISFNRKAADNMNGNPEDFTGKSIYDLFPKASADVYLNRIKKTIDSESPQFYEDKVNLPSGDLWFHSTFTRILDSSGRVIGVQVISTDITDRKQTEARINTQMDELRRWQNITLGREDRILQLKGEVNRLLGEAGKPPRYASAVEPVDE